VVETLLNPKQSADLTSLLAAVSVQARLGSGYREEADYWAGQVASGLLAADDMQTIAWLLEEVAGSPWLPDPIGQWARAWAATIKELTGLQEAY
jgi:hypothetical protein